MPNTEPNKPNNLLSYLFVCIFALVFTTACGLSGDRGGTGGRSSSGSGGSGSGSNEDETGVFQIKEKIGIRVERINGDVNEVQTSQISIISLDQNFNEIGGNTPDHRILERETGGYEIQFSSSYVETLNRVVKVTFSNRTPAEFLYAPLYTVKSDTDSITVSPRSHYLLKKMFDSISTENQLNQLLPCSTSDSDCENQSFAKSKLLEELNIAVTAYNVDIDEDATVSQAMSTLDDRLDLKLHIESGVNEISRTQSPFAKGTRRNFNLSSANLFVPNTFHSLLFGLSFSNVRPDDNLNTVKVNSFSSTIVPAGALDNSKPIYPLFTQTTSLLDMRRDVMSSDMPFNRTSVEITQSNNFSLIENEELNSLTSNLADSLLSTEGFLLNSRVIEQTIPGEENDIKDIGWEFEPLFARVFQANEYEPPSDGALDSMPPPDYGDAPTWLVSSNFSKAASFALSSDEDPVREEKLEDSFLFSWEVHGLQVDKTKNFSTSAMNGKEYGAISYSLKLNDQNDDNILQLLAETARWEINSGQITMSQPTSFYRTFSLSRDDDNNTSGVRTEFNLLDSPRNITTVETNDSNGFSEQGLVAFGGIEAGKPQGHASENGKYLAFVFNTFDKDDLFDRGQGIILASELANFNYEFSGQTYQLQGNSFEITSTQNTLHNLNGSRLVIDDRSADDPSSIDCNAVLTLQRASVSHIVGSLENTLTEPSVSSQSDIESETCSIDSSQIELTFPSTFGETLTMRGFITDKNDSDSFEPGNLINFIWRQDSQLGLVFANKEQGLSSSFDE